MRRNSESVINYFSQFFIFAIAVSALGVAIRALVLSQQNNQSNFVSICKSNQDCASSTLGNSCLDAICIDGSCQTNLTMGAECAFSTQCSGGNSVCNDECMCSQQNISSFTCSSDPECDFLTLGNPCLDASCVDGQCQTNLTLGAECAYSTECLTGQCNSLCMCQVSNSSSVILGTWDPTFADAPFQDPFFNYGTAFELRTLTKEYDNNIIEATFNVRLQSFAGATPDRIQFLFSLPFPANTSADDYPSFVSVSPSTGSNTIYNNPNTILTSLGVGFVHNETFGSTFAAITNPDFTSPSIQTLYRLTVTLVYERL